MTEAKGLKHRATDATREVPRSQELVRRLRDHLGRFEAFHGRLFSNAGGRPPTSTNYGPVWLRARARLWPVGHPLASATVYDLRHAAATAMVLRAGVPPAEVARRLGHSVDVRMSVYAVFDEERERSNQLLDKAMRRATR